MKNVCCLQCGHEFAITGAFKDELGWGTLCPICDSSFDVDIDKHLIPNGTKVKFHDSRTGIIDGNDEAHSDEFENINYYICPVEFTHMEVWSDHYIMLPAHEFEIIE